MKNSIVLACFLLCSFICQAKEIPGFNEGKLVFIANAGQVTDQHYKLRTDIDFKLNAAGMDIFIGDGEVHYQFTKLSDGKILPPPLLPGSPGSAGGKGRAGEGSAITQTAIYRLDVKLVGANKNARLIAEEQQEYYERYYLAHTPEEGVQAYSYRKIIYQNIYPHIDWVLYVKDNQLKYDFIVHPGGNVKDIQLKYDGATDMYLKDGSLVIETPFGSITEQPPFSYEANNKKEITSAFVLNGDKLTFDIDKYHGPLVIDPTLDWATYYGNTGNTLTTHAATDAAGFVYISGRTFSTSNIATAGTHQVSFGGGIADGYIAKFDGSGNRIWGTYYGGAGDDFIDYIVFYSSGIYATGATSSFNGGIATTGSHQPLSASNGVALEGFLVKFNDAGQRLWGTYFGGLFGAVPTSLAADNAGNIYMAGRTLSNNNIATPGSFKPNYTSTIPQTQDAFLVKFNSSGTRLWGTYYGGAGDDRALGVVCDAGGDVYLSGISTSDTGIATVGSYQPARAGSYDNFLVRFTGTGSRVWGTYYGGPGQESLSSIQDGHVIAYDAAGFILVPGLTQSSTGIATPGCHQPALGGGVDAFLSKFSVNGVLQWATYYGGTGNESSAYGYIAPTGTIYLSGTTASSNAISTPGSFQPALAGLTDAFLVKFNASGQRMEGTYFGGAADDYVTGMAFSGTSGVYISGWTQSSTGIATTGSFQPSLMAADNGFLAKFIEDTAVFVQPPFIDTQLCRGQNLPVAYGTVQTFKLGNVFTVQLSDAAGSFASPVTIGTAPGTAGPGTINCTIPPGTPAGNGYRIRIVASHPVRISQDNGLNIRISDVPVVNAGSNSPLCVQGTLNLTAGSSISGVSYSWAGPGSYTSNQQNPSRTNVAAADAGIYTVTVNNMGCTTQATTNVTINSIQNPNIGNSGACIGGTLNLTASTTSAGASYSWTGPSFTSNQQNPTITGVTAANAGTYTVVITANGCSDTLTTNVSVGTPPNVPTANSNSPVCVGQSINLNANSTTPGVSYSWTGPGSYSSTQQNPTRINATTAMSGPYSVVAIQSGCSSAATVTNVTVNPVPPAPTATNNGPVCAGVALDLFATGQPGATYNWTGPSYTSITQNPTILNATTANAGTYTVTQTVAGCTSPSASTNVVINNSVNPTINIFPNPNDSICPGTLVTFVAVPTNGGTSPQYRWYKNGNLQGGAGLPTYQTTTYNTGDYYSCELTSNTFCAVPATLMSNNVTLTVIPPAPAQVSISASPGLVLSPWQTVSFTATPVMGGAAPVYQWLRNGQPIIGATSNNWSAYNLSNGDTISVVLTSSDPCAIPNKDTSNILVVQLKTGISGEGSNTTGIRLYPNPNNGDFTLIGNINLKEVNIDIINAIGQTIYTQRLATPNGELEHQVHLNAAGGIYLLRLATGQRVETFRFRLNTQ